MRKIFRLILLTLILVNMFLLVACNCKGCNGNTELESPKLENKVYTPKVEDIQVDEKTGISYVNNMIIIIFENDTSYSEVNKVVSSINGAIVGQLPVIDQYQVQVTTQSLAELEAICDKLKKEPSVFDAIYDMLIESDDQSTYLPNDPWGENNIEWDITNPAGMNWWAEAIDAPNAWYYNKLNKYSHIKIGVIDTGVDLNHEDLKGAISISSHNNVGEHGTLVSGIIAAQENNKKGITGLVHNAQLYTYDKSWRIGDSTVLSSRVCAGLAELVENGVKVVNFSVGYIPEAYQIQVDGSANLVSSTMSKLLSKGYDFIVVQSAGNDAMDASRNGFFCSIDSNTHKLCGGVSLKQVLDRIIVVGAVENLGDNAYRRPEWSNYGERVDIWAPGRHIYTTTVGGYDIVSGTSVAAPIVTGIASMVWSVNPNLTGAEVKNIVCNEANTKYDVYDEYFGITYRMVNANLAVEDALKTLESSSILGTYDGTYTAPQGLTGMTLSIHRTQELLEDDVLLQKYADIANKCSESYEDEEPIVFTPTMVRDIISQHQGVYIAIFNYYPVVDEETDISPNPDVEEGLYTMSVNYNLESKKYEFVGVEWIQRQSYSFADLKNVTFNTDMLSGDVYGWQGIGFLVTYEDVGDFSASKASEEAGYSIAFENDYVELDVDKEVEVNAIVKNNLGVLATQNVNIKWFSADENIVKIEGQDWGDSGYEFASAKLVGINEGETIIYAELENKRIAMCKVRVNSIWFEFIEETQSYMVIGKGSVNTTDVVIPKTYKGFPVKSFSQWAFVDSDITSITIPDTITEIPEGVFRNCFDLTYVELPNTLEIIGDYAFEDCISLKTIKIPNSVQSIGYAAFSFCRSLEIIYIPSSVTKIDFYAFNQCESLRTIVFEGTIAQWNRMYKGDGWNSGVPAGYVTCSDGRVVLSE